MVSGTCARAAAVSVWLVGLLVVPVPALSAAGAAVLDYSFDKIEDGKVLDLSGNSYHGEIMGEPEEVDGGLRFRGGTFLIIPEVDAMNVGGGGFIVEMVFELEPDMPWSSDETGVAFMLNGNYREHARALQITIGGDGHLGFTLRGPRGEWRHTRSAGPLPVGEAVHVAAVLNGDAVLDAKTSWGEPLKNRELNINGKLQPGINRNPSVTLGENVEFRVGAHREGRRHFRGIFRRLRFYARPLLASDDPVLKRGRQFGPD